MTQLDSVQIYNITSRLDKVVERLDKLIEAANKPPIFVLPGNYDPDTANQLLDDIRAAMGNERG